MVEVLEDEMNHRLRQQLREEYQKGYRSVMNEGIGGDTFRKLADKAAEYFNIPKILDPKEVRDYLKSVNLLADRKLKSGKYSQAKNYIRPTQQYINDPLYNANIDASVIKSLSQRDPSRLKNPFFREKAPDMLKNLSTNIEKRKRAYDEAKKFLKALDNQAEYEQQMQEIDPDLLAYILRRGEFENAP